MEASPSTTGTASAYFSPHLEHRLYLFTVSGVQPKEEVLHLFVNDEGVVDEGVGRRIAKRAGALRCARNGDSPE